MFTGIQEIHHSFLKPGPLNDLVKNYSDDTIVCIFVSPGVEYNIYIADTRELEHENYGESISGDVTLSLPHGRYKVLFFSPEHGEYNPKDQISGSTVFMNLTEFRHDIVVRLRTS